MAIRYHNPAMTFGDSNNDPLSGAKLYFYEAGTTTPLDTFSDEDLTTANANPVVADSAGKFGDIWLKEQAYKVILKTSADVTVTTMDPWNGSLAVTGDDFKVSPQDPADMTIDVSAGTLYNLTTKTRISKATQTSGTITAPGADPRIDVVYVDQLSGVFGITTGSEAASPSVPTIPDGKLPLAEIALAITTTEITDSLITDIRELANIGGGLAPNADGGITLTDTDDGAGEGPLLILDRNSASPAASDFLGSIVARGQNDNGEAVDYAEIKSTISDDTDGTEDGAWAFHTIRDGTKAERMRLDAGMRLGAPTDGDKGAGTINAENGLYDDGARLTGLTLDTEQSTSSGTNKDFTGIPAGTKRITIQFVGVSTDSSNGVLVQIGDSGGIEATGYTSASNATGSTTGFIIDTGTGASTYDGTIVLTLEDSAAFTWVSSHVLSSSVPATSSGGGSKSLSAELTQVRIVPGGSDNFDAGAINILYE